MNSNEYRPIMKKSLHPCCKHNFPCNLPLIRVRPFDTGVEGGAVSLEFFLHDRLFFLRISYNNLFLSKET